MSASRTTGLQFRSNTVGWFADSDFGFRAAAEIVRFVRRWNRHLHSERLRRWNMSIDSDDSAAAAGAGAGRRGCIVTSIWGRGSGMIARPSALFRSRGACDGARGIFHHARNQLRSAALKVVYPSFDARGLRKRALYSFRVNGIVNDAVPRRKHHEGNSATPLELSIPKSLTFSEAFATRPRKPEGPHALPSPDRRKT